MSTNIPAFLISVLIHVGLLALVLTSADQLSKDTVAETRLAVSLEMFQPPPPTKAEAEAEAEPEPEPESEPEPEPEPPPPPKPVFKPKPKPSPLPKPKPRPKPKPKPPTEEKPITAIQVPVPPAVAKTIEPAAVAPAVDMDLMRFVEEKYKAALRQAIERNKDYPRRAIRLRQEGEVVVGFTVRRNGDIESLRIIESSGNRLLDKAAHGAVKKVSGKLPFPEKVEREFWEFVLPIKYSLR